MVLELVATTLKFQWDMVSQKPNEDTAVFQRGQPCQMPSGGWAEIKNYGSGIIEVLSVIWTRIRKEGSLFEVD